MNTTLDAQQIKKAIAEQENLIARIEVELVAATPDHKPEIRGRLRVARNYLAHLDFQLEMERELA